MIFFPKVPNVPWFKKIKYRRIEELTLTVALTVTSAFRELAPMRDFYVEDVSSLVFPTYIWSTFFAFVLMQLFHPYGPYDIANAIAVV